MAKTRAVSPDSKRRFDPDPERSYTLPARYYIDPEIYQREKEAIFFKSWQFAGHVEELAEVGSYITSQIHDQSVFIMRGKDKRLRAFYNVCSHRAHELLEGSGKEKMISCPYHGWTYELDGSLFSARGSEKVEGFDRAEFCLKEVRLEQFANLLFFNLDPGAAALSEQAGDLEEEMRSHAPDLDRLTHARRLTYDIEANWKIVVDNFLECYHCPIAHPAFAELVDLSTYRPVTHGIWSSHFAKGGGAKNVAYDFSSADFQDHAVWWLWPNVCFLRFPGSGNMMVLHILPVSLGRTFETYDFYFLSKELDRQQLEALDYIDEVLQPEDITIVESVQRGLRSRAYGEGRLIVDEQRSGMSEHGVHHFHSLLLEALGS